MIICEFCKKIYSNKGNLVKHQETTKKCIHLQQEIKIDTQFLHCKYCNFTTKKKHSFTTHFIQCTEIKIQEYEKKNKQLTTTNSKLLEYKKKHTELLSENEELQQYKILYERTKEYKKLHKQVSTENTKLQEYKTLYETMKDDYMKIKIETDLKNKHILFIETEYNEVKQQLKDNVNTLLLKPTSIVHNSHTNTTNQLKLVLNVNDEYIQQKVHDYFNISYLIDGIKGVAKFTTDYIINKEDGQSKYICTDVSRIIFKYKDDNGNIVKDVKATKLKNLIKDPIKIKSQTLYLDESTRLSNNRLQTTDKSILEIDTFNINNLTTQFLKVKNLDDYSDDYARYMMLMMNE